MTRRRTYQTDLPRLRQGFNACWKNSLELLAASKVLLADERAPLSLSVSVLAIEEIGKLMFIDGLLYSRAGDYKTTNFNTGHRRHQWKLTFVEVFPLFIQSLASADPRYFHEVRYFTALQLVLGNLQNERAALTPWLASGALTDLDGWKQRGFYVSATETGFFAPQQMVPVELALGVQALAARFVTTVDFLLKDGNLERYFERANNLRSVAGQADHEWLQLVGSEIVRDMFEDSSSGDADA